MPDIASLLAEAAKAKPIRRARITGKWAPLYPVFRQLRERKFSGPHAVDWLIEKGQVESEDRGRAINALQLIEWREKRKLKRLDEILPTAK